MSVLPYRGRTIDYARPVQVYRNLRNAPARWSIRQDGLVVAHADRLSLGDVTFPVSARGAARSRSGGRKTVCAFAVGTLHAETIESETRQLWPVRLDLARGAFLIHDGRAERRLLRAHVAVLDGDGLRAYAPGHESAPLARAEA